MAAPSDVLSNGTTVAELLVHLLFTATSRAL